MTSALHSCRVTEDIPLKLTTCTGVTMTTSSTSLTHKVTSATSHLMHHARKTTIKRASPKKTSSARRVF
jgi:hypothetical protein